MLENPLLHNALGSATSGIIARVFTHPLDTAKARLQAPPQATARAVPYRGTVDVLFRTVKTEGITALYRGFGAILIGGTPGTMAYLCGYDYFKDNLAKQWGKVGSSSVDGETIRSTSDGDSQFGIHFAAGMLAETLACIVYVPVDVIKERLQVQQQQTQQKTTTTKTSTTSTPSQLQKSQQQYYNGSYDALRKILKTEGVRGIYKGYGATLASFGPFSALYFVFYEQMKSWSIQTLYPDVDNDNEFSGSSNGRKELPFVYLVGSSASAGAAASWLTSPLDMAKLRLQIQRGVAYSSSSTTTSSTTNTAGQQGMNMIQCLTHIYQHGGGIRGLFRGAGARVIHFAPATAITMTCYEKCRLFYAKKLSPDANDAS